MTGTMKGAGYINGIKLRGTDTVIVKCHGRDRFTGAWAEFDVVMTWDRWMTLEEQAYNDRESNAQERIPY